MRHPLLNQGGTTKLARPSSLSRGGGFFIGNMLKWPSKVVLGSKTSSTYPESTLPVFSRLRPRWKIRLSMLWD